MMRSSVRWLIIVIFLAVAVDAGAQGGPHGRGPGPRGRLYDPKTVETVAGEVVAVERGTGPGAGGGGIHLVLRTDAAASFSVRLGPASYVDRQPMKIAAGDRVEVQGSRVTIDGKPALIAAEVRKGSQTLVLRDAAGVPRWSGGGRGAKP